MQHHEIISPLAFCACVNICTSWLAVLSKFLLYTFLLYCGICKVCFSDIYNMLSLQQLCVFSTLYCLLFFYTADKLNVSFVTILRGESTLNYIFVYLYILFSLSRQQAVYFIFVLYYIDTGFSLVCYYSSQYPGQNVPLHANCL